MRTTCFLMVVFMSCPFYLQPVASQETSIPAAKDNTIYSESDSSNGKGTYLFTGLTRLGNERRTLLKFDLSALQPADSIISATLKLYLSKTTGGDISAGLYRMKRNWGESTSLAPYEEGGGASPDAGDATWNYAFYDTLQWDSTGGDHEGTASAFCLVGQGTGYYSWTNDTMISDIRKWMNQPDSNFGWILIVKGKDLQTSKRFNSRENNEFQPGLIVNLVQPTSLADAKDNGFSVFPNPSSGILYIRKNDLDIKNVSLIDITGREIKWPQFQIRRISSGLLSCTVHLKGSYLLKVDKYFRKIIIL